MDIQQLKDLVFASPFQSFTIVMNSGRMIEIPSRDHVMFVPGQPVVVAIDPGNHIHIVAVSNISTLSINAAK